MSKGQSRPSVSNQKTITFKLKWPIEFGEQIIDEFEIRRPRAKDIEHLSASPTMKELLQVGSKIAGQPKPIIDQMDAEDAIALAEVVGDFLAGGQRTGKTD